MNNLKPCPFCGGIAELKAPGYEHYSPCWCKCTRCGAEGPTKSSELEAEKGWNERAQKDKWISSKDRIPDKDEEVILFYEWTGRFSGNKYQEVGFGTIADLGQECFVIAWMPIPEPPNDND